MRGYYAGWVELQERKDQGREEQLSLFEMQGKCEKRRNCTLLQKKHCIYNKKLTCQFSVKTTYSCDDLVGLLLFTFLLSLALTSSASNIDEQSSNITSGSLWMSFHTRRLNISLSDCNAETEKNQT